VNCENGVILKNVTAENELPSNDDASSLTSMGTSNYESGDESVKADAK
jgi:hypothetical protein